MKRFLVGTLALTLVVAGCGGATPKSDENTKQPAAQDQKIEKLTIGFVPSSDAGNIDTKVKPMSDFLSKKLGIEVKTYTGTNYIGVVEGMGSKQVDLAFLNPLGYVLASGDHGAQVLLKTVRKGSAQYRSQLTTRKADNIPVCDMKADPKCTKTFEALKGKKLAFVEPASTSGYLFPSSFMKGAGVDPEKGKWFSEVIMAGQHDAAAKGVYNKVVDASWTFEDVQANLLKEFPDVKEKLVAVAFTDWIPNDTVSYRKGLPADLVAKIKDALQEFAKTDDGKTVLKELYSIDGFTDGNDKDYDVVRNMAKSMGVDVKSELSKKK